jgi:two-component system CitB family sensor kinase
LFISLLLGGGIALFVAFYLKRQLHNLEPQEISRLLEERNSMLEETKDVVFVLDLAKNILLANRAATALPLATASEDGLVGQSLLTILPALQHVDFDKKQERLVQQEGQDYVFSSAPIIVRNQQIGHIIFLRNATESLFIADQLANTTAYATALQSQAHEFMNKLHVIYGLVDLEAYEELTIYLDDILKPEKEFAHRLAILIKNPLLAGFLIGERQKFLEKKCQLLLEIFPEIPQGAVAHETKVLLNLYQYIHHLLLQKHLTQEVFMKIEYQENQLQTSWQLVEEMLTPAEQVTLQQVGYFQQLLHEVNGTITFQEAQGVLEVTITNDYRKEQL